MKWLVDLNVLLDVIQQREPFFADSALVISRIVRGDVTGYIPGHELTTAYYVVSRYADREAANDLVDWLVGHFEVVAEDSTVFRRARELRFPDFEDAAVASAAEAAGCDCIVTRNTRDFAASPTCGCPSSVADKPPSKQIMGRPTCGPTSRRPSRSWVDRRAAAAQADHGPTDVQLPPKQIMGRPTCGYPSSVAELTLALHKDPQME